jgi:hypothetical protein
MKLDAALTVFVLGCVAALAYSALAGNEPLHSEKRVTPEPLGHYHVRCDSPAAIETTAGELTLPAGERLELVFDGELPPQCYTLEPFTVSHGGDEK